MIVKKQAQAKEYFVDFVGLREDYDRMKEKFAFEKKECEEQIEATKKVKDELEKQKESILREIKYLNKRTVPAENTDEIKELLIKLQEEGLDLTLNLNEKEKIRLVGK